MVVVDTTAVDAAAGESVNAGARCCHKFTESQLQYKWAPCTRPAFLGTSRLTMAY